MLVTVTDPNKAPEELGYFDKPHLVTPGFSQWLGAAVS